MSARLANRSRMSLLRELKDFWIRARGLGLTLDELIYVIRMVPPLRAEAIALFLRKHPAPEQLHELSNEFPNEFRLARACKEALKAEAEKNDLLNRMHGIVLELAGKEPEESEDQ